MKYLQNRESKSKSVFTTVLVTSRSSKLDTMLIGFGEVFFLHCFWCIGCTASSRSARRGALVLHYASTAFLYSVALPCGGSQRHGPCTAFLYHVAVHGAVHWYCTARALPSCT